jgi:hypothetical protein
MNAQEKPWYGALGSGQAIDIAARVILYFSFTFVFNIHVPPIYCEKFGSWDLYHVH